MPRPPRTELRGRNGAPIFLRSQFLTSGRRGTDRALSDSRAHRAERRSVTQEKRSRVPLGSSSSETPARTATSRAPAPCARRARTSCSSTSANCATRATRDPAASTRAAARSRETIDTRTTRVTKTTPSTFDKKYLPCSLLSKTIQSIDSRRRARANTDSGTPAFFLPSPFTPSGADTPSVEAVVRFVGARGV